MLDLLTHWQPVSNTEKCNQLHKHQTMLSSPTCFEFIYRFPPFSANPNPSHLSRVQLQLIVISKWNRNVFFSRGASYLSICIHGWITLMRLQSWDAFVFTLHNPPKRDQFRTHLRWKHSLARVTWYTLVFLGRSIQIEANVYFCMYFPCILCTDGAGHWA